MYLFLDTETTGFAKKGPLVQEGQARVCQIAAILCDEDGKHMAEFCALIKPDGWEISKGAQEVHGISMDRCEKFGIGMRDGSLRVITEMMNKATHLVCHNIAFDNNMLDIEYGYVSSQRPRPETFCTMLATVSICKLPGQYGNYKWPKLKEALPILCGRELGDDAHDAMVDTKGCKDIFFELKRRGLVNGTGI